MAWTCEQTEARLSEYLDGLLGAAERSDFDAHMKACLRCAPQVARVASLVVELRNLEPVPEPPQLVGAILDKTIGPRRAAEQSRRSALGWFSWLLQPKLAYGAASIAFTFVVVLTSLGFNWRKPKLADLNPVNLYRAADRQAHLVYARGAKFMSDMRVVYEIQSRLRPEPDVTPEVQPSRDTGTPPGSSRGPESNHPRQQNRANDLGPIFTVLASALPRAGERSLR
jgi:anti-sigma factor RsiW